MLPDFVIAGAMKGGTTAAAFNLSLHPDICVGEKELRWFGGIYGNKSLEWYQKRMNQFCAYKPDAKLFGDKSPGYLFSSVDKMKPIIPNAKIIFILRNPVTRFISHYRMMKRKKVIEVPPLDELFDNERSFRRYSFFTSGLYCRALTNFFQYYPRDQIHIAISERVRADMTQEYSKMYQFLGVEPFEGDYQERHVGKDRNVPFNLEQVQIIKDAYYRHNLKLYRLLDYEIPEWETRAECIIQPEILI